MPAAYAQPPAKPDYGAVKAAISDLLDKEDYDDGSYGPIFVRLAWHASGTYDKNTNTGGSNGATMRCVTERLHLSVMATCAVMATGAVLMQTASDRVRSSFGEQFSHVQSVSVALSCVKLLASMKPNLLVHDCVIFDGTSVCCATGLVRVSTPPTLA